MLQYLFYNTSFIIIIPFMLIAMWAQSNVKNTYKKFLRVNSYRGMTGQEVAKTILLRNGINDVSVEMVSGIMSDHYDPRSNAVRLSRDVFMGTSISSVSIAAHEVGHAIQHAYGYAPLKFRTAILPLASFGSSSAFFFVFIGMLFNSVFLMDFGIWFFTAAVIFQIITLPVEFNASARAIVQLEQNNLLSEDEILGSKKVLKAAALTYVAATAIALAQLLRLLLLRNSRD